MSDNTVLGLAPAKYVKITYILLLVSAGVGALLSLLALVGFISLLGAIGSLAGLVGLIMAVVGWAAYKDSFSSLEIKHLQYVVLVFLGFFIVNVIISSLFMMTLTLSFLLSALLNAAALVLLFTGFNSWQHGRTITKTNLLDEVKLALKRA